MKFEANVPIYLQIIDEIKRRIIVEEYGPGQKLPSVREFAVSFGVNPNTVQRAFAELEREGLVHSERTSGRFICDQPKRIHDLRASILDKKMDAFLEEMERYGYDRKTILTYIRERYEI